MPTYEYHCDNCDRSFDIVQGFHDEPLTTCPTCGHAVRKVFGNVGIVFKGSGFYKTDSRSTSSVPAGPDKSAGSGGAGDKASEKPASGGSDGASSAPDSSSKQAAAPASSSPSPSGGATASPGSTS